MEWPETTLSWLAALIDGEGSIMITNNSPGAAFLRKNPKAVNHRRVRLVISVSNTHLGLLSAIIQKTGLGTIYTHTRQPKENHKKTSYTWRLNTTEIREILPSLAPWLIVKREQADLMMEALGIKEEATPAKGKIPTKETSDRLRALSEAMSILNKKGREES